MDTILYIRKMVQDISRRVKIFGNNELHDYN